MLASSGVKAKGRIRKYQLNVVSGCTCVWGVCEEVQGRDKFLIDLKESK